MSEQMEKLVEEVINYIWGYFLNDKEPVTKASLKRLARLIIALIGKAYADGELELPNQKWRGWGRFRMDAGTPYFLRGYLGVVEIDSQIKPPPGLEYDIIALSGTGKEEDK